MLKFLYRKLLLTHSGSFRFQSIFFAAMLLYLLFLRLDPGWTFVDSITLNCSNIFICLLLSPQLFHPHSCGFSNYSSCSNRCGGPCLHPTIRPSPRAKDCRIHLFRWKENISLILITFPQHYLLFFSTVGIEMPRRFIIHLLTENVYGHRQLNPTAQINKQHHSLLQLRHTLSRPSLQSFHHLLRLISSSISRTVGWLIG